MARYGTFKYSQQKYGASDLDTLLWALEVDWDGDDVFDGSNEAGRMVNMQTERGNDYFLSSDGNGFDPMGIGNAIITLDNHDGRYDPYNTSSPLYGYLEPGKKIRLSVKNGSTGTLYRVFSGILQDIQPMGRRDTVDLIMEDCWRWLADRDANTVLYQNICADDAISHILDSVAWPAIWGSALETGPDTIPYWWGTGKNAKNEIEDIANSGLGKVFVAADGKLKYYSRQKSDSPVMVLTEDILGKDITIPQPWEFRRNIIKVQTHPRVLQSSQVIWTLRETPLIIAGEIITLWATYTYDGVDVPATNIVTPASTTDYTANDQQDGSGSDYTAYITVTITKYSNISKIIYRNNSAANVYLTFAQLRGMPINAPDTSIIVEESSGSTTYPKTLEIDLPWQQNYNTGYDLAVYLADFLGESQPFPTIFVRGRPEIQFGLDLYDKITLRLNTLGIDKNFRIGKIKHTALSDNAQDILTEFKLFPIYVPPADNYWYLGTAGLSELGVTTYLGV